LDSAAASAKPAIKPEMKYLRRIGASPIAFPGLPHWSK